MPITYPEGGMPGLLLKQRRAVKPAIDTFKVQLVPLRAAPKVKISGPEDVAKFVREMEDYDRESAKIIHMDTKNQVMGVETISIGSLNMSIVHPRETVKGAILNNSANVIFVHNHPSGICEPSTEDVELSGKLKEAFELVGISLLDSVIVGKGCYYSLRETGFITGQVTTPVKLTSESKRTPIKELPKEKRLEIARGIAATTGPKIDYEGYITHDQISKMPPEERKKCLNMITAGQVKHSVIRESTAPLVKHIKQEIKATHALAIRNDRDALLRAESTVRQIDSGVLARIITQEEAVSLKEAVKKALQKAPYSEIAKLIEGVKVELKYEPRKIFPWRVVYAGTDETVQTREYPEAMAYYTEIEAKKAIAEEGLTLVNIAEEKARQVWLEDAVYEYVKNNPRVDSADIVSHFKLRADIALKALAQLEKDHKVERKWLGFKYGYIPLIEQKSSFAVSENIQTVNNIEVFLNRLTVDTRVPIPESAVIGAAIPEGGFLFAYHVTDYPEEVMRKLRATSHLCELNPQGDLGCGFYVSGAPQYWLVRSREKWEFARHLNRAQRQALVTAILSDPKYRKGGGYLADFEVDYLNRDLKRFVETGDVNLLAMTGNQPYNVRITEEIARKASVPVPKMPKMIKVKLQGKFINAAGLYSNPEIVNRAQAWAVINRPKLLEWNKRASTQDIVNAWLCSKGYSGAFTKSGMSTNPEMVIWDRRAIIGFWIPEPQT